jgi:hypothetical protein
MLRGLVAKGASLEFHALQSFLTSDDVIWLSRQFLPHGEMVIEGICASAD